jgi:hypothetical protein
MRLWLMTLLFVVPLFASSYSPLLLRAQASIFPKMLLLVKEPQRLLVQGSIVFAIVYEEEDRESAFELKTLMQQQYKGDIEGYPFKVILVKFNELNEKLECSAIMALHSDKHMAEPVKLAIEKKIVSFVADAVYLKEGYLFSLNLERSTVIYMNKPMLPYYGIEFSDTLYHVVRFFDENKKSAFPLH